VKKTLDFSVGLSPICFDESDSDDSQFLSLGKSPDPVSVETGFPVNREKPRRVLQYSSPLRLEQKKPVNTRARVTGVVPPRQNNVRENIQPGQPSDIVRNNSENSIPGHISHDIPDRPASVLEHTNTGTNDRIQSNISNIPSSAEQGTRVHRALAEERSRLNTRNARNEEGYDELVSNHLPEHIIPTRHSVPPNLILSVAHPQSHAASFSASNMQLFQLVPIGGQHLDSLDSYRIPFGRPDSGFNLDKPDPDERYSNSPGRQFQHRNNEIEYSVRRDIAPRITEPLLVHSSRRNDADTPVPCDPVDNLSESNFQATNDLRHDVDTSNQITEQTVGKNPNIQSFNSRSSGRVQEDDTSRQVDSQRGDETGRFPGSRLDKRGMRSDQEKESPQMGSKDIAPKQPGLPTDNSNSNLYLTSERVTRKGETFCSPSWKMPTRGPKPVGVTPTRYSTQDLLHIFQSPLPLRYGSPTTNIRPSPKQRSVKKELSAVFQSEPPKLIHNASPLLDRDRLKSVIESRKVSLQDQRSPKHLILDKNKKADSDSDCLLLDRELSPRLTDANRKASKTLRSQFNSRQPAMPRDPLVDADSPQQGRVLGTYTDIKSPLKELRLRFGLSVGDTRPRYIQNLGLNSLQSLGTKQPRRIALTTQRNDQLRQDASISPAGKDNPLKYGLQKDLCDSLKQTLDSVDGNHTQEPPLGHVRKQDSFRSPLRIAGVSPLQEKRLVRPNRRARKDTMVERPSPRNNKIQHQLLSLERKVDGEPGGLDVDISHKDFNNLQKSVKFDITNRNSENKTERPRTESKRNLNDKNFVAKPSLQGDPGADYLCFQPNLCSTVICDRGIHVPEVELDSSVVDEMTQLECSGQEKVVKWLRGLELPEPVIVDYDSGGTKAQTDEMPAEEVLLADSSKVTQNKGDIPAKLNAFPPKLTVKKTFADILIELKADAEKEKRQCEKRDKSSSDDAGSRLDDAGSSLDVQNLSSESAVIPKTPKGSGLCVDKNNNAVYRIKPISVSLNIKGENTLSNEEGISNRGSAQNYTGVKKGSVIRQDDVRGTCKLGPGDGVNSFGQRRGGQESKILSTEPLNKGGRDSCVKDMDRGRDGDGRCQTRVDQSRKRKYRNGSDSDSDARSKLSKMDNSSRKSVQGQKKGRGCDENNGREKPLYKLRSIDEDSHRMKRAKQEKPVATLKATVSKMSAECVPRMEVTFMEMVDSCDDDECCPSEGCSFASPCAEKCLGDGQCNKSFCFDCA
jgi:hypothetical protein